MDGLVPLLHRLQDALVATGLHVALDLPQVAVVGAQSVGKSSVLESLVGRDFLPRGVGIVTRRPLILHLKNIPGPGVKSWGEFAHLPGQRFENFDGIRQEIDRETERVCGPNKNLSKDAIILRISSPHVVDLTLIDLPGLTTVPVGDQPVDISQKIRELVLHYIRKPNCLIMAVSAANVDIANSDALRIAREVDPQGSRTIGVLTKIDIMDEGTHCMEVLEGKLYPLKLGYVGVVCRSQKDTSQGLAFKDAQQKEKEYLTNHPMYRRLMPRCGTQYLAKVLNTVLIRKVKDELPELKNRIMTMLTKTETELAGYEDAGDADQGAMILHLLSKYARNFADAIDGKLSPDDVTDGQITGGARIHYVFHDVFAKNIMKINPLEGLSDHEIRVVMRNAVGPRACLFVPEAAFEILVKKQIGRFETPATQCVEMVFMELLNLAAKCDLPEMTRFVRLRNMVLEVVQKVLRNCLDPTNRMISNLVQIELAYINTSHPDFNGFSRPQAQQQRAEAPPKAEEPPEESANGPGSALGLFSSLMPFGQKRLPDDTPAEVTAAVRSAPSFQPSATEGSRELNIIKNLICSYFDICRKNIMDSVPKAIMYFLVNTAKDVMQKELISQLYNEDKFADLLTEAHDIPARRQRCREHLKALKNAFSLINQMRDNQMTSGATFG